MAFYNYRTLRPLRSTLGRVASTAYRPTGYQPPFIPTSTENIDAVRAWYAANQTPQFTVDPNTLAAYGNQPKTPQAAPAASAGFTPSAAPQGAGNIDYSGDPILAKTRAFVEQQNAAAQAQAQAAQEQNLIRYGDPNLVAKVLGGGSEKTQKAARENTFGTVQELGRWNQRALSNIDQARNAQNLFFSSTRARDRGLQEEDLVRQQTTTGNQLQDVLVQIANGLLAARQQDQGQIMSAEESAYGRALQDAMQRMYYTPPPPSDTSGGGYTQPATGPGMYGSAHAGADIASALGLPTYKKPRPVRAIGY